VRLHKQAALETASLPPVRVFRVAGASCPPRLLEVLSAAERQRHEVASLRGRTGYGAGRAALRLLLGAELGLPPHQVVLIRRCMSCGQLGHGKPAVNGDYYSRLGVSVSTSNDVTPLAIAEQGRVGVDLEEAPTGEPFSISRPCFSARERRILGSLRPQLLPEALVRSWVRKEAVAKCLGHGLAMPLSLAEVSGPAQGWQLPDPSVSVVDLELAGPLVAALAHDHERAVHPLQEWEWGRWLQARSPFPPGGSRLR